MFVVSTHTYIYINTYVCTEFIPLENCLPRLRRQTRHKPVDAPPIFHLPRHPHAACSGAAEANSPKAVQRLRATPNGCSSNWLGGWAVGWDGCLVLVGLACNFTPLIFDFCAAFYCVGKVLCIVLFPHAT